MPAYPNALMQATPRNAMLGKLADALAGTYGPERTQQAQQLAQFLSVPAISRTLDKLSYGEPLTTGAGGIGGTTKFNNEALEAAFAVAPMVGPAAKLAGKGAMATGRFVAPKAGQLAEQYMVKTGGILPLDVYHGTPHTLPPTARNPLGEFDASKIGTGEGAQAYGHGLYFAENPAVAKEYQVRLSSTGSAKNLANQYGDVDKGITEAQRRIQHYQELITNGGGGMMDRAKGLLKISEKNLQDLSRMKAGLPENTGSFYKIDLPDEKIAKMLDYDKPLSEQSIEVQKILFPYQKEIGGSFGTGEQTLKAISFERRMKGLDDSPAAVAQQLREMGIPGVRYVDEGSRNLANTWIVKHPQGGENVFSTKESAEAFLRKYPEDKSKLIEPKVTRNFVVFPGEEKSMTILERNGQKFDNSALMAKKFDVVKRDASKTFGAGAERFRYTDPASGGMIDVLKRPDNTASVIGLEVPEAFRGKGIGESLQSQVLQDFPAMMGQVSSKAAAKTAYRLGRRPPNQPNASLDDVFKIMDENSSVNLVSPKMQQTFNPAPTSTFDNSALMK